MKPETTLQFQPSEIEDHGDLNLQQYFYIINRYKWKIIFLSSIITILSALYVNTLTPKYRATATLFFESAQENIMSSIEQIYSRPYAYTEFYISQMSVLKSRDIGERVIDKLDLLKHPKFAVKDSSTEMKQNKPSGFLDWKKWTSLDWFNNKSEVNATKSLQKKIPRKIQVATQISNMAFISHVPDSHIFEIHFDSTDPKLAADLANAMVDAYLEQELEIKLASTKKASEWMTDQLAELKQKVDQSEQAFQNFLDQEKLIDTGGVDGLAVKTLDDLSIKLVEAQRSRSESDELYRQIIALEGQPTEAYESIPAVLRDGLVHSAKTVQANTERKVSELGKRYGPKHPKMLAAQAELDSANNNLQLQIKHVIESVKKEYAGARAEESHFRRAVESAKNNVTSINRKEYELKTLQHEVDSNRKLYDLFLARFKETVATDDLQTPIARVLDYALVPSSPYKPNKKQFITVSFILSIFLCMLLAFIIEALDNTIKDSKDVEFKLFLPVLSILPKLNIWVKANKKVMRYFTDHKHSNFSENIRTIRTNALLNDIDNPKRVILVTSSVPEEGKSIIAVNLALSFGQMGKTLLIDADMRKPSIVQVFGLDKKTPGLSHFIAGSHDLEKCVHYFEHDKLYVMPSGVIPSNPLELLSSKRFEKGLESLKQTYDYIVVDSAPAVPVSDAVVLSRIATETIYVIKADDTPYQLAKVGIKKLQQVDANIIGVVLNQVNPTKKPGRYGYAESDYYTYYGYNKS